MTDAQTASAGATAGRRTVPPFRADHVGSLLRPQKLLRARDEFAAGQISAEQLRAIEDDAIRDVVQMQRDVGLQSATDGEFRRASWHMDFIYQLGGVEKVAGDITVQFRNADGEVDFKPAAIAVTDQVRLDRTIFAEDFEFLKGVVGAGVTPKLTIPSPNMVHYRGGRAALDPASTPTSTSSGPTSPSAYADQVRAIAQLGCTYLQFDDTSLAYLNDPPSARRWSSAARTRRTCTRPTCATSTTRSPAVPTGSRSRPTCAAATSAPRGRPRAATTSSPRRCSASSTSTASSSSTTTPARAGLSRCGSWRPGKLVVLGLVTTKRGELESKDELKRRIEEASRFVPIEQLCLSPQCGFSSTVEGNVADATTQQVAKLELIVETAAEVWG